MPRGCCISARTMLRCHWCTLTPVATSSIACLFIHIGVGLGVARFDRMGNSQEPQIAKRATVRASRFFCVLKNVNYN